MKIVAMGILTCAATMGIMALAWPLPYWRLQSLGICVYLLIHGVSWMWRATLKVEAR